MECNRAVEASQAASPPTHLATIWLPVKLVFMQRPPYENLAKSLLLCLIVPWLGCRQDAVLGDRPMKTVTVRSVTHYGVTLDQNAAPRDVAYVALRAIRDDFLAKTPAQRDLALDTQFDLVAANVLGQRNRSALTRDEWVNQVVYLWTPTISHYVGDIDADLDGLKLRLVESKVREANGTKECNIYLEVDDPSGDPNARVVLAVYMAQDSGHWRVLHFGFVQGRRSISTRAVTPTVKDGQTRAGGA